MNCTFLKLGNKYINPEHIVSFEQDSDKDYLKITTLTSTLHCPMEKEDFIKMLQEVNYTIKEFKKA